MSSAAAFLIMLSAVQAPTGELEVAVERLRNQRGVLHLCLTRNEAHFPDCGSDPQALKRTVPAGPGPIRFAGIAPGGYALSIIHDENRNGRLDTLFGIPREGFGFSRNPVIRFGAPRFGQVRMELEAAFTRQVVRMQYLL